jgi:hypothetical protein
LDRRPCARESGLPGELLQCMETMGGRGPSRDSEGSEADLPRDVEARRPFSRDGRGETGLRWSCSAQSRSIGRRLSEACLHQISTRENRCTWREDELRSQCAVSAVSSDKAGGFSCEAARAVTDSSPNEQSAPLPLPGRGKVNCSALAGREILREAESLSLDVSQLQSFGVSRIRSRDLR